MLPSRQMHNVVTTCLNVVATVCFYWAAHCHLHAPITELLQGRFHRQFTGSFSELTKNQSDHPLFEL